MNIDIVDGVLQCKSYEAALKSKHISQLKFWGFARDSFTGNLVLEENTKSTLPKLLAYLDKSSVSYHLTPSATEVLQQLLLSEQSYDAVKEKGQALKEGRYDKDDFTEHVRFVANHIPRPLKEHQLKASYHLWLVGNGANFSVPGSGKTTVVLTVFERLRLEEKVNVLFVVGPPSSFGPWKHEFQQVLGRKAKSQVLAGGAKTARRTKYFERNDVSELYLTTFQTLMNDYEVVSEFFASTQVKAMVVIDEAHYIKQIEGSWAKAALKIARNAKYRCILTGTPIPKSYSDLFNLFDFLWLGHNPISPEEKVRLSILEEQRNFTGAAEILEPSVGPLFYRVRKKELSLEEQVFNEPDLVKMNPYEQRVYNAITSRIRQIAQEDYRINHEIIDRLRRGRMIRLRQCLSYTGLLETTVDHYNEDILQDDRDLKYIISRYATLEVPGKIQRLLQLVANFQAREEKVVIWANFIGTIKLIERHLKEKGYKCKKIIGETPIARTALTEEDTREKIRDEFVDPESGLDILLANPAACAESISLHKTCYHAVYYDLSYNCAQFLQSLDRIHRVGGSERQKAYYHFLQYEETTEPDILDNLQTKAQKMYDIIEGDYNIYSLDMLDDSDELTAYRRLFLQEP